MTTFLASSSSLSSFKPRKTYYSRVYRFIAFCTRRYTLFINLSSSSTTTTTTGGKRKYHERKKRRGEVKTRAGTEYRTSFVSYLLRWEIRVPIFEIFPCSWTTIYFQRRFNVRLRKVDGPARTDPSTDPFKEKETLIY